MPSGVQVNRVLYFLSRGFRDMCLESYAFEELVSFLSVSGTKDYTLTPTTSNMKVNGIVRARIATLVSPTITLATATTGGTLAASTYSYRVTATNDSGETLQSSAVIVTTTGSASTVTVSWSLITNATGYKVYGRVGGSELLMATYSTAAWDTDPVGDGTITQWTDDGSVTPSGSAPDGDINVRSLTNSNTATKDALSLLWRDDFDDSDNLSGVTHYIYNGVNLVRLNKIPRTSAVGLFFKLTLFPTNDFSYTTTIPQVFEEYDEALKSYAKWKIYGLKDKPWYDPVLSEKEEVNYTNGRGNLTRDMMLGYGGEMVQRPTRLWGKQFESFWGRE